MRIKFYPKSFRERGILRRVILEIAQWAGTYALHAGAPDLVSRTMYSWKHLYKQIVTTEKTEREYRG